jgi:rare lipoprotein A (peptidoglycan hydrolase)
VITVRHGWLLTFPPSLAIGRYTPLIEQAIRRSARRGALSVLHDAGPLDILKHVAKGDRAGRMRNVVFSCAVLCGLTGSASAAEQGLASYFQYSHHPGLFAAHRSLPIGSQVRVVNLDNGRSVVVTILAGDRSFMAE